MTTTQTIDGSNIGAESYHNLCVISDVTRYSNPISALKATGEKVEVTKDECGNVCSVNGLKPFAVSWRLRRRGPILKGIRYGTDAEQVTRLFKSTIADDHDHPAAEVVSVKPMTDLGALYR